MLKPLAIYLPQFHPVPENDAWWGKGFTEWTNVAKATPRFEGHYQPHLPSDLGYYDLRLHKTMVEQAALAKENGIYGFMFYHYWFTGKRLLERPVNQWLMHKEPNFPFCICWANENWTRRWDGMEQEVLMKQDYSAEDDRLHFQELLKHFRDERYIRIDDKPVFIVYRTHLFPDIQKTANTWREEAHKNGLSGIYLVTVHSFGNKPNPKDIGFDAAIEFQPDFANLPTRKFGTFKDKLFHKLNLVESPFVKDSVYSYAEFVEKQKSVFAQQQQLGYTLFPGITPMWDNAARRKENAFILHDSTPEKYGEWLRYIVAHYKPHNAEESFLFINAWNEWAEGNHLEPCARWGKQYLEETLKVFIKNG